MAYFFLKTKYFRDKMTKDGRIPFWAEVMAGGMAGASQVNC